MRLTDRFGMKGVVEEEDWTNEADREVWFGRADVVEGEGWKEEADR